jgi:hypothetical protein
MARGKLSLTKSYSLDRFEQVERSKSSDQKLFEILPAFAKILQCAQTISYRSEMILMVVFFRPGFLITQSYEFLMARTWSEHAMHVTIAISSKPLRLRTHYTTLFLTLQQATIKVS